MSARSNARFIIGLALAFGIAPQASADDPSQQPNSQPSGPAAQAAAAVSLPIFLDAARLPDIQAAWRTRFGGADIAIVVPAASPGEPEANTISQARQTLSRGEVVSQEAAAVRERAEELSRRFAVDAGESNPPAPDADPAVAAVAPEAPVVETASISTGAAPAEAADVPPDVASDQIQTQETATIEQVSVQQVSLRTKVPSDAAPASMLGGPRTEEAASASENAPVIDDMATKPRQHAKRSPANPPARRVTAQVVKEPPTLFGIFSLWGSSTPAEEETTAAKSDDPDINPMLPREIRSFGWNAQP